MKEKLQELLDRENLRPGQLAERLDVNPASISHKSNFCKKFSAPSRNSTPTGCCSTPPSTSATERPHPPGPPLSGKIRGRQPGGPASERPVSSKESRERRTERRLRRLTSRVHTLPPGILRSSVNRSIVAPPRPLRAACSPPEHPGLPGRVCRTEDPHTTRRSSASSSSIPTTRLKVTRRRRDNSDREAVSRKISQSRKG